MTATSLDPAGAPATQANPAGLARRIEPTEHNPLPSPPCSGNWLRDDDGGVRPADARTAADAGLAPPPNHEPE